MRAQQILAHLRKLPFVPIRIFVSDGATYDVRHPEMAAVSAVEMVIGLEPFEDDVPQRFAYRDPVHITRIEPINGRTARRKLKRR
jgi:hypothetical protein